MALSEYRIGTRTYLLDEHEVPEGAELITKDVTPAPVVLFPDQVKPKPEGDKAAFEVEDKKKGRKPVPANKAGRKPADKADKPADEATED